ncbi:MAG: putative glycolipid-binding domain-containing protein [Thermoleophilaceae bacterium]
MRRSLAWRGLDEWRAEGCTIELGGHGLRAAGVQLGAAYQLHYRLETGADLLTRRLALTVSDVAGERSLLLERSEDGAWSGGGEPLPHVEGALDCDMALSPLTNYMPAARLGAEPADHVMAWVDVPSLEVLRSEQRYEPLDGHRVRYVGLDHDFTAELELDADGFVTRYPGLAERVAS